MADSPTVPGFTPRMRLQGYKSADLPIWYKSENQEGKNPYNSAGGTGNCTWYAFGRFSEIKGSWANHAALMGDAGNWWYSNKSTKSYQYGKTPAEGAIACWGKVSGDITRRGHVAIVEKVISDTTFISSESGWQAFWFKTQTRNTTSKISGSGGTYKFLGFIYNPGGGTGELGEFSDNNAFDTNDEEGFGLNTTPRLYYGEEVAGEIENHIGESGQSTNDGDWGVTLLYNVFKTCGLELTCFNLPSMGTKNYWSYEEAYDWLMRNGTFIYDYTPETVEITTEKNVPDPDPKRKNEIIKETKTYKVNNIDDFKLADTGDIVFLAHGNNDYSQFDGIGVVIDSPKSNTLPIVAEYLGTVVRTSRHMSTIHTIIRPPYGVVEGGIRTPEYAEFLHSSQNYEFAFPDYDEPISRVVKKKDSDVRELMQASADYAGTGAQLPDTARVISTLVTGNVPRERTRFEGDFESTAILPTPITPVEAPYISVTMGGVTFGTYQGRKAPPNYINGLVVKRTNNSLNEYTISLIHQVSPGDNPNYIDELIAKNGYNEITIDYGEAEGGISFRSVKALLTDVHISFDFINCNITYILSATSSAAMSVTYRTNFPAVYEKPSTEIRKLISRDPSIKSTFPVMSNLTYVDSNNLIPNTDIAVDIPAMDNITALNYIRQLTTYMTNNQSKTETGLSNSVYVFYIDDNAQSPFFRIAEINTSDNINTTNIAYTVDIGYPDNAQVFDFKVNTDYAWAMAYNYDDGLMNNFKYGIDDVGNITSQSKSVKTSNWWTKMTEMPISATLTTRGLVSPMLLMTYIKVNCHYYGSQRVTGGVYIVVGQTDRLDKNGFRTELELLRVAGANQYLNIDGRVET